MANNLGSMAFEPPNLFFLKSTDVNVTPQVSVHLNTYHCTLFNLKRKMWEINPKRRGSNKSQNIQKKLKEKEKGVKNYSNFKSKMCTKF